MTQSELLAAFEIEYARDCVLRALVALAGGDKQTIFMAWSLGHVKGISRGIDRARDIFAEVRL